jgi:hypothetical protein
MLLIGTPYLYLVVARGLLGAVLGLTKPTVRKPRAMHLV